MKIEIFEGKKTVTIDDELARVYATCKPKADVKNTEFLLLCNSIESDTNLSDEELSEKVDSYMRDELKVVYDMEFGGKKEEGLSIAKEYNRKIKSNK